ncbi:MAG: hypothetical protein VKO21_05380 [Candidatus Sericytochromatia bacterium]|nr:hypothetical protein [Candidatus Sericytochromatia bacterium]
MNPPASQSSPIAEAQPRGPVAAQVSMPAGAVLPGARFRVIGTAFASGQTAVTGEVRGADSPLAGALVTFMDDEGQFLVLRDAQDKEKFALLSARTNPDGRFETPGVFAEGQPLVAQVLFGQQRRLLAIGTAGTAITVDPASTMVLEFLRTVQAENRPGSGFLAATSKADAKGLVRVAKLETDRLRDAVRDKAFVLPATDDESKVGSAFTIGRSQELASQVLLGLVTKVPDSHQAWQAVLDRVPLAVLTDAGNTLLTNETLKSPADALKQPFGEPTGVEASGSLYFLSSNKAGLIDRVAGGSRITYLGLLPAGEDPSTWQAGVSEEGAETGSLFAGTLLASESVGSEPKLTLRTIVEMRQDRQGNMAMTFDGLNCIGFAARVAGTYFGRQMEQGKFYWLGNPDLGYDGAPQSPLESTAWGRAAGLAFDDTGNLYVADRGANLIRRIDHQSGEVRTVIGDGWPYTTDVLSTTEGGLAALAYVPTTNVETPLQDGGTASVDVPDFGRMKDAEAGPNSGLKASLHRPTRVVWQRRADGREELFILDLYNQAVRHAIAPPGGDFSQAAVTTLVGQAVNEVRPYESGSYVVPVGTKGLAPDQLTPFSQMGLDLAEVKGEYRWVQPTDAGLALDRRRQRLYLTMPNSRRIVMLDLASGKGRTIAKDSGGLFEGAAMQTVLPYKLGGLDVLDNGDVIFADTANNAARRLRTGVWVPD